MRLAITTAMNIVVLKGVDGDQHCNCAASGHQRRGTLTYSACLVHKHAETGHWVPASSRRISNVHSVVDGVAMEHAGTSTSS